jgi:hypothetical protein
LKSIKNKILAFAVLATLIPSIGLGLLSFWRYQNLIGDNATLELRTAAGHTSNELALWLRERVNEVRALSTANTIIDGLRVQEVMAAIQTSAAEHRAVTLEGHARV